MTMMRNYIRIHYYRKQNNSYKLTPRQLRRALRKANKASKRDWE